MAAAVGGGQGTAGFISAGVHGHHVRRWQQVTGERESFLATSKKTIKPKPSPAQPLCYTHTSMSGPTPGERPEREAATRHTWVTAFATLAEDEDDGG